MIFFTKPKMANQKNQTKPWSRQKDLQKTYQAEEVPGIDELALMILKIKYGNYDPAFQTLQARALAALYYLTAARASEVVRCESLRVQKLRRKTVYDRKGNQTVKYDLTDKGERIIDMKEIPHDYEGIFKNQIKLGTIDNKRCMYVRIENRKNKNRKTKRQPIPIEFEKEIVKFVIEYIEELDNSSPLFPFGPKRATQIINETLGFNIHFIRHIRATHLVTIYDFNEQALINFMGWTDARPAKAYMELQSKDIFRQFYKNKPY